MSSPSQFFSPVSKPAGPSPFSFHCIICFEAFDHNERTPVVLPCGHTFLCAVCSKRLKKCMECRTPLFITKTPSHPAPSHPVPSHPAQGGAYGRTRRYASLSPPPTPPPPPVKQEIALPLPKNLLLLSIMETAEREARAKRLMRTPKAVRVPLKTIPSTTSDPKQSEGPDDSQSLLQVDTHSSYDSQEPAVVESSSLFGEFIDEDSNLSFEEDEDAAVWSSISRMSSTCGTYAVTERAGLIVLPQKPADLSDQILTPTNNEKPSQSIIPNDPNQTPPSPPAPNLYSNLPLKNAKGLTEAPMPYELPFGSRIQVVSIENGWAQLARNRGYLRVNSRQLVKVGGPMDQACEIEGMLLQLDQHRRELINKQTELSRIEAGLEKELDEVLLTPACPDGKPYALEDERAAETSSQGETTPKPAAAEHIAESNEAQSSKPAEEPNSRDAELRTPSPTDVSNSIARLNLGIPKLSPTTSTNSNAAQEEIPPNFDSPPLPSNVRSYDSISPPRIFRNNSSPFSRSRRPQSIPNSPSDSSASTSIDFRTGLSGHCGLSQSHAPHPHPSHRTAIRMMSEHRGIGMGTVPHWGKRGGNYQLANGILCTSPESARGAVGEDFEVQEQASYG